MPVAIDTVKVHTKGMGVRLVKVNQKYELIVPEWDDSRYARLSEGQFWEAEQAWRHHTRLMRLWAAWHYTIGSVAVALAAFAGFGSLAQILGERTAAFITIGSGVAMGLATFLRSDDKRCRNEEMAVAWEKQMDDVAFLYETRPDKAGSPHQTARTNDSGGPEGWETIAKTLRERAQSIRVGQVKLEDRPVWPGSKSG